MNTSKATESARARFEKHFASLGFDFGLALTDEHRYINSATRMAWAGWLAALSSPDEVAVKARVLSDLLECAEDIVMPTLGQARRLFDARKALRAALDSGPSSKAVEIVTPDGKPFVLCECECFPHASDCPKRVPPAPAPEVCPTCKGARQSRHMIPYTSAEDAHFCDNVFHSAPATAPEPAAFKVGDRVRVVRHDDDSDEAAKLAAPIGAIQKIIGVGCPRHPGHFRLESDKCCSPHEIEPAPPAPSTGQSAKPEAGECEKCGATETWNRYSYRGTDGQGHALLIYTDAPGDGDRDYCEGTWHDTQTDNEKEDDRVESHATARGEAREAGLTHEQLVAACKNIGYDLTCGECASVFFTGYGGSRHDDGCSNGHAAPRSPAEARFVEAMLAWFELLSRVGLSKATSLFTREWTAAYEAYDLLAASGRSKP